MPSTVQTERLGIAAVDKAIASLGGFFRELPGPDDGIDAQIEWANAEGRPSGRLLGVQVKAGPTYFKTREEAGWRCRVKKRHLEYWGGYGLPVIFVIYDPESDTAYWQEIAPENLHKTAAGGYTISIPETQVLDTSSVDVLVALANRGLPNEPSALASVLRERRAEADIVWMELLDSGARLFVEAEEWINKSSGQGSLRLVVEDQDGTRTEREWPWLFLPGTSYAEELPKLFPWADLKVDVERFRDEMYPEFLSSCGVWDSEAKDYLVVEDFDEWIKQCLEDGLQPYAETAGEVAHWRLELKLNKLGQETLDREREADLEESWMEFLAEDARDEETQEIRRGYYEGQYGDGPFGRMLERVLFFWGDSFDIVVAAELLWTDEAHRIDVARAILGHALQREPTTALAKAFVGRFKEVLDDEGQGWQLSYSDLSAWLFELGVKG